MSTKSLWGELPPAANIRTPVSILREQATVLAEATRGVLAGEVAQLQTANNDEFVHVLMIVAPALNNYRYRVLTIAHHVTLYPVVLHDGEATIECADEADFITDLEAVLSSQRVHKAIGALLAQSNAA